MLLGLLPEAFILISLWPYFCFCVACSAMTYRYPPVCLLLFFIIPLAYGISFSILLRAGGEELAPFRLFQAPFHGLLCVSLSDSIPSYLLHLWCALYFTELRSIHPPQCHQCGKLIISLLMQSLPVTIVTGGTC